MNHEAVGRYTVFSEIASGAMGAVHFGRLRGEGDFARTVVIKRMHRSMLGDAELVASFVDEARLAARVRHPNVVATLDVVVRGGEVFVAMEYVDGESLAGLLRTASESRLPPRIAAAVAAGVLHGLHAAHEATDERGESLELVHRDVSPSNILVGVDGVARIIDFGIAKALGRSHVTRDGHVKGKLAYMPPEQLYGEALDRRTDVYAAGVVLWEALTGRRLFGAATESETIDRILNAAITPPGELDEDLRPFDAIVLRALARDPGDRFDTAEEMALVLEASVSCATASEVGAWVESVAAPALAARARALSAIESAPAAERGPATRPTRSFRALVVAAACAAGAFAGGASIVVMSDREPARAPAPAGAGASASARAAPAAPSLLPAATAPALSSAPEAATARPLASTSIDSGARVRRISSQPRGDECSMPYAIDSAGRKHYKPNCLQ